MKNYSELEFEKMQYSDIETLTPIIKKAFDEDTRMHLMKIQECILE